MISKSINFHFKSTEELIEKAELKFLKFKVFKYSGTTFVDDFFKNHHLVWDYKTIHPH